jgi:peptidoglycan/xylan/chitin deacetylase (PgdA/CDA1 family)
MRKKDKFMWNGKKKAITFSFDDGVMQDIRAIEILDKYGLRGTFNLNSGRFGAQYPYEANNRRVERVIVEPTQVKQVYKNHEVAVHTITHFNLTELPDSCIVWQVEEDRKMLECLTGNPITCMAYPCGGVNNDDRVAEIIKNQTQIRFARTTVSTYSFVLQENLLQFNPTIHFGSERIFELAEEFLFLKVDEPKLFYIWGHTYELDAEEGAWERFEKLCKMISGKDDIFYGTNGEVFNG